MRFPESLSRQRMAAILAVIMAFIALATWAVSSPVGSSPDDNFHLSSIWCSETSPSDLCSQKKADGSVLLPRQIHTDAYCFIFKPEASAECQGGQEFRDLSSATLSSTSHLNTSGAYPPLFYATMGFFAGEDLQTSVITMRIFNVCLFLILLLCMTHLLPKSMSFVMVGGFLTTMIPLGAFIIPSTNPSSWGYIASGMLWLALLRYFDEAGMRKWTLGLLTAVLVLVGAGSRSDVAAYLVVGVVIATIMAFKNKRTFYLQLILPTLLVLLAVLFYKLGSQSGMLINGFDEAEGNDASLGLLVANISEFPTLVVGIFGSWGLGWLDTPMPAVVWFSSLSVFVVALFVGLYVLQWRKFVGIFLSVSALIGAPILALFQSGAAVGNLVQPRYLLPSLVLFVGVTMWKFRFAALTTAHRIVILVLLGVANLLALWTNFRRYTTGLGQGGFNLDSATWWWLTPFSPQVAFLIGASSMFLLLWLLLFALYPKQDERAEPSSRQFGLDPVDSLRVQRSNSTS